jgi:hypothetical protein
MNDELECIRKAVVVTHIDICLEDLKNDHERPPFKIAGVPAQI